MKRLAENRFLLLLVALCLVGLAAAACTSDSPSEPSQQPAPTPPGTTPPSGDFTITVTADPAQLVAEGDEPSVITIRVQRRSNGAPPPDGTTVQLTASLGDLGSPGSGVSSGFAQLVNGFAQALLFPGSTQGTALVQARLEGSVGQASVRIVESATFFISFLQPTTGSPNGGDNVTIVGGGFAEPVRVTFDGVAAQVLSVSPDRIRVVTPPSTAQVPTGTTRPVTVAVTINLNESDQATDALPSGFTYVPGGGGPPSQPQIFSVTPASGLNEGGTRVTIVGDGFQAPVQVFFGQGNSASSFNGIEATVESVSQNQLIVRTPAATGIGQDLQNQLVDILIRNLSNGFSTVAQDAFRYGSGPNVPNLRITAVSPNQIAFDAGSRVTIFGQGFDEPVAVSLAGIAATPLSVTGTEIIVRAGIPLIEGCSSETGDVVVTNIETGETAAGPPTFIYLVTSPVVTGISPNSGTGAGGTTVTVRGINLAEPLRVFFGDSGASLVSVAADGSSATVVTPSFNEFDEEDCDDDGDGTVGMRFVRTSVDVRVENLLTDCEDIFTGGFTYIPTDLTCRGDAGPPPPAPTPQCSDGIDNDSDGFVDHATVNPVNPDPQCAGPNDDDESA